MPHSGFVSPAHSLRTAPIALTTSVADGDSCRGPTSPWGQVESIVAFTSRSSEFAGLCPPARQDPIPVSRQFPRLPRYPAPLSLCSGQPILSRVRQWFPARETLVLPFRASGNVAGDLLVSRVTICHKCWQLVDAGQGCCYIPHYQPHLVARIH